MGNLPSIRGPQEHDDGNQPAKAELNLKLEAQRVKDFTGNPDKWQKWKSRTLCAFSGSGYEQILESEKYAQEHPRYNKVVFSQLSAATVDGTAYHLIQEFETTRDGHLAWKNLCEWYDGEDMRLETAEGIRIKLDNLTLHSGISASDYINKFLAWYRDLAKIPGEGYTKSHAVYIFLKHITDEDYKTTVTFCRNTKSSLADCISAIRKHERDITQQKLERHRLKATIKRLKETMDSDDEQDVEPKPKRTKKIRRATATPEEHAENCKFEGELIPTDKGLLRFVSACWKKMDDKAKDFVRDYNASVKHGDLTKVSFPEGISVKGKVRRTQSTEDNTSKKTEKNNARKRKKGVTFGIGEVDHSMGNIDE